MLKFVSRNASVLSNEQYLHPEVAFGLLRYPPAVEMKGSMYCWHVWPETGSMVTNSTSEHWMGIFPSACPRSASMR